MADQGFWQLIQVFCGWQKCFKYLDADPSVPWLTQVFGSLSKYFVADTSVSWLTQGPKYFKADTSIMANPNTLRLTYVFYG
jgi:hypothetical protein